MRNNKTILEDKYNLSINKTNITCNICGYNWTVKRLRYDRNMSCPNCHPIEHGSSAKECELYDLLATTGLNIIHNDRNILNGKELDIYFPDLKFAIEYDGEYWHSQEEDEIKNSLCIEKGIELLRIKEKDYNKNTPNQIVEHLNNKYNQKAKIHPELVKNVIRVSGKSKKIICTDTMEIFNNYIEAANKFGCKHPSFICNVCNGSQPHYKGYHFKYYNENEHYDKTEISYNYNSQHIECVETEEVFESISNLKKLGVKSIWDCINGKQSTANKLHWKKTDRPTTDTKLTEELLNIESNSISGKQVVCVETNEIFPSCQAIADKYNITKEAVSKACRNNSICQGLHFKFTGIETISKRTDNTKIKCIETNEIFSSAKEAAKKFELCEEAIRRNCLGKTKKTKIGYTFEYVGKTKTIRSDNIKFKKVKNLTTGEIYNSIKECAEKLNAPNENSIARVCRGERKTYKGYYLEYLKEK